jgi:hypothetical protein
MNNDLLLHGSLILILVICAGLILRKSQLMNKRTDKSDDEDMHWL